VHYAVQKNDARAVDMLLKMQVSLAYERNQVQQTPLHAAARYGSPEAIKALLRRCPDVAEMVDGNGCNVFHAAVVSGKLDTLRCLLSRVRAAELLNQVDGEGNTPLYLSASMLHIPCALMLLEDRRVAPCILNGDGQTARSLVQANAAGGENAMDAYEMYLWKQLKRQESKRCRKHQLPPVTLPRHKGSGKEAIKQSVGIHLVIATLVATVTFAATITMPGGYSQVDGTAIHAHRGAFKVFVISDTVAMCSSIVVLLCFLWAWQDPSRFRMSLFVLGHRLNIVSCLAMLISLMAAVYVTVASVVPWLAYFVIAIGAANPVFVFLVAGRQLFYSVEV